MSTLKVYLAPLSVHQTLVNGPLLGAQRLAKIFLKGAEHLILTQSSGSSVKTGLPNQPMKGEKHATLCQNHALLTNILAPQYINKHINLYSLSQALCESDCWLVWRTMNSCLCPFNMQAFRSKGQLAYNLKDVITQSCLYASHKACFSIKYHLIRIMTATVSSCAVIQYNSLPWVRYCLKICCITCHSVCFRNIFRLWCYPFKAGAKQKGTNF